MLNTTLRVGEQPQMCNLWHKHAMSTAFFSACGTLGRSADSPLWAVFILAVLTGQRFQDVGRAVILVRERHNFFRY